MNPLCNRKNHNRIYPPDAMPAKFSNLRPPGPPPPSPPTSPPGLRLVSPAPEGPGLPPPQNGLAPGGAIAEDIALLRLFHACAEAENAGVCLTPLTGVAQGSPTNTLFLATRCERPSVHILAGCERPVPEAFRAPSRSATAGKLHEVRRRRSHSTRARRA